MKHYKSAVFTALFSLCLIVTWIILTRSTVITEVRTTLFTCTISSQDFSLQWKHSVEKTQWVEYYQRHQDHFILQYTDVISFGAGTPSDYPIIFQKNGVIRMQVDQKISDIRWTVSKNMQGTILVNNKIWLIYQHLPTYSIIEISPQLYPLWKTWQFGECV